MKKLDRLLWNKSMSHRGILNSPLSTLVVAAIGGAYSSHLAGYPSFAIQWLASGLAITWLLERLATAAAVKASKPFTYHVRISEEFSLFSRISTSFSDYSDLVYRVDQLSYCGLYVTSFRHGVLLL